MASNIQLHRLGWLDNEITRYRNYEWRVASFFNAFYAAMFFLLVDADRRRAIAFLPSWLLALAVWSFFVLVLFHAGYVHRRLNERRLERHELYKAIGGDPWGDFSPRFFNLWEGWGALVFLSLVVIMAALAGLDTALIARGIPTACPALPSPGWA
jgi:hypothetical protein